MIFVNNAFNKRTSRPARFFYATLLFGFCLCSCGSAISKLESKYSIGTKDSEIKSEQERNSSFFEYINYAFWEEDGCDIAVHYNESFELDAILIQKSVDGTKENFAKIENGDGVFDVVSLIGSPFDSVTSDMITLGFYLEDDEIGVVYFNEENEFLYVIDTLIHHRDA